MTADKFNAALLQCFASPHPHTGAISLGQIELARALQIGERSVRRYASGQWPVPPTIAALLNLMVATGKTAEDIKL
jgi:hypothetical protein